MAKYSAVKATVNAYIKQNGRKEITGRILNAVLNATIDSLGKYFQFAGCALPTDDPGTPDQNVCYLAGEPGVYTNFGGITIENEEVALLFWDGEWTKQRILIGIREVNASVDNQVGTPSVDVSYSGGELVLTFHNLKGDQGETGDPAGFGTIGADINGGVGTPGVSVETSGDNTAKNLMFHFTNLKGETGVTSVVATIDDTSGTPSCQVSLVGQQLTLAFSGLKGLKGDTGVSADYPITIYNGLDSDATDQALAAAQGKVLDGKVSQLEAKVTDLEDGLYGENKTVYENDGEIEYYEEAGTFTGWNGVGTYSGLLAQESKITRIVLPPFKIQYTSPKYVKFFIGYTNNITNSITPNNLTKIAEGVIPGVANNPIKDYTILLETPVVIPANNRVFVFLYNPSYTVYLSGGGNDETSLPSFSGDARAYLLATASQDTPFNSAWGFASETNTARYKVCQPILLSVTNGDLNDLEVRLSTEIEELSVAINGKDETVYENEGEWETLEQLMTFSSWVGQGTYTPPLTQDTKFNEVLLPPFGSKFAGTHNMKYLVGYGIVPANGATFNPSTGLTMIKTGVIENIVGNDWIENFKIELDAPVTVPAGENVVLLLYIQGTYQETKILGYGSSETSELPYNDKMAKALFALSNSSNYDTAFESTWYSVLAGATRQRMVCTPILKLVVKSKISETVDEAINEEVPALVDEKIEGYNSVKVYLPNKLYAVVGDTLQLFFHSIVAAINIADYDIYAECSKGKTYPRYFSYTPAAGDVGTTTLTVYVKDRNNNILGQASCDLVTVSAPSSPVSAKSIFTFGDSLTTFGQWPGEAKRRLVGNSTYDGITGKGLTNLSFFGYMNKVINGQSVDYFGVGGWTWANYLTKGTGGAFRFYVTGVSSLSIGAKYTNNGFTYTIQEINVTGDSGNIRCTTSANTNTPSASGTLTKESGDGDATITFNSFDTENANPLWDDANNKMSFIPYVQDCGASTIDAVYVLLSWNGQAAWKEYSVDDTTGHIANAKTFARTLHAEYPNAKLFIMGLQMPSDTGGLGANYGATGGYIDGYGLKQCALNYNKALQDLCNLDEFSPYCEFVDVAAQFDSHYNMPYTNTKVNKRNTVTEMLGTNGVHPADPGYFQIADAVYRSIVANFCQ